VSAFSEAYSSCVTTTTLREMIEESVKRPMTREERFEQKVSFVYGVMDADSGITKEHVRAILTAADGGTKS
jgi:hypothetical protein